MNNGSIIRNLGGTSTFEQPPQVHSFDAVSQVGRLAGTKTVNGVRHGWTSYKGIVTFLDLPNAPNGDFFRPVDIDTCGNNIVGVHVRPNGEVVGGVLFSRQSFLIFQQCDTPPVLTASVATDHCRMQATQPKERRKWAATSRMVFCSSLLEIADRPPVAIEALRE
jgi:hypothetical protein